MLSLNTEKKGLIVSAHRRVRRYVMSAFYSVATE
jgi:hypothetical protein